METIDVADVQLSANPPSDAPLQVMLIEDTPCHRLSVSELPDEQLESWLRGVRDRRMALLKEYKAKEEYAKSIKCERAKARLAKVFDMLDKKMKSVESALDGAEKYINEAKMLRFIAERSV